MVNQQKLSRNPIAEGVSFFVYCCRLIVFDIFSSLFVCLFVFVCMCV